MTAANQSVASTARVGTPSATTPPGTLARVVLLAVILVNLAIVEVMFIVSPAAKHPLLGFGRFLGLHASLLMIFQLVLISRLPWLERRVGMDRLTLWHRWNGLTLFWVVLLHPTFVLLGYATHYHSSVLKEFKNLAGMVPSLLGMLAAATVVITAGLSIRFARRRMS